MRAEKVFIKGEEFFVVYYPDNYRDCVILIKSDDFRVSGTMNSFLKLCINNVWHYNDSVLFWFRLCQYRGCFFRLFCHIYNKVCRRANVYLPPMTRVGFGLDIGHGMSMVINGGTIIGNNVNLSHFVSIGTNHDNPAIIGDNVYIGPNTNIVEDVCIGSNVTIGAGAVVTKDIPSNATAVGSPAKVINYNNPARYIKNPYPLP